LTALWCVPTVRKRRVYLAVGITAVAAVAVLLTVAAIVVGGRLRGHAERYVAAMGAAAAEAERAREAPLTALGALQEHLGAARQELEALRPFAAPLVNVADWLTARQIGEAWPGQAAGAWRFADAVTALGEQLTAATRDGLTSAQGGPAGLAAAQPELLRALRAAEASFAAAAAARAEVGAPAWPLDRLAPALSQWDAVAPRLSDALAQADRIGQALPLAFGSDRPYTYLVLAQTSDDLRATGGFISSIGIVRIEGGRIISFDFEKVYAAEGIDVPGPDDARAEHVSPPAPLGLYMGLGEWRLRDANWWADFPSTARQAARFWESVQGTPVDGVIAFNEEALETVLRAVGPVTLEGGAVVTADTLRDVTLAQVFQGDEPSAWYAAQSAFSRNLAQRLIAAAEQLEPDRLMDLGWALHAASVRRDLMVSSFEPQLAALARTYAVDGALLGGRTDYVYLVEQNVSYGKLSPFIRQSLDYTVDLDSAARPRRALLAIDMVNEYAPGRGRPGYPDHYYNGLRWNPEAGRMDLREGYYGGYTRLYLPLGSRILGISGFDEGVSVGTESGKTVVGGYVGLDMGGRRRIQVEWEPSGSSDVVGRYQLLFQRQPGAPHRDLTVRARVPAGVRVSAATPEGMTNDADGLIWRGSLERDLHVEVTLAAPDGP
jgi:hypothetical protein